VGKPKECLLDDPFIVNVGSTEAVQLSVVSTRYTRVLVKVRTMGSASLVELGSAKSREVTLTDDGDAVPLQAPPCRYYDLSKVWAEADGDGAILEVWGDDPVNYIRGKTRDVFDQLGRVAYEDLYFTEADLAGDYQTVFKNVDSQAEIFTNAGCPRGVLSLTCKPPAEGGTGYIYAYPVYQGLMLYSYPETGNHTFITSFQARFIVKIKRYDATPAGALVNFFCGFGGVPWGEIDPLPPLENNRVNDPSNYYMVLQFSNSTWQGLELDPYNLRGTVRDHSSLENTQGYYSKLLGFTAGGPQTEEYRQGENDTGFWPHWIELVVGVDRNVPYFLAHDLWGNKYVRARYPIPPSMDLLSLRIKDGYDEFVEGDLFLGLETTGENSDENNIKMDVFSIKFAREIYYRDYHPALGGV